MPEREVRTLIAGPPTPGQELRRLRIERGMQQQHRELTHTQMADLIGVNQGQYSRWEKDVYYPTRRWRARIETIFGLAPGHFDRIDSEREQWEEANPPLDRDMVAIGPADPALTRLLHALAAIEDDAHLREIITQLEGYRARPPALEVEREA